MRLVFAGTPAGSAAVAGGGAGELGTTSWPWSAGPTPRPGAAGDCRVAGGAPCSRGRSGGAQAGAARRSRSSCPGWPNWPPTAARSWRTARCCPARVLALPGHGWVNLHFSLLPAWRGAAPVQHALLTGDEITGASTFRIVAELDAGPVFGLLTEPILADDTAGSLLDRLAVRGAGLLVTTLDGIEDGTLGPGRAACRRGVVRAEAHGRGAQSTGGSRRSRSTGASAPARLIPGPGRRWTAYG